MFALLGLLIIPMPFGSVAVEQPGMLSPAPVISEYVVEIDFTIDSSLVQPLNYRCNDYVAGGHFVVDRYPSDYNGGFYMSTIGNGLLCWMDHPWNAPNSMWVTDVEIPISYDIPHTLIVTRNAASLTLQLDGAEVFTTSPSWWASQTWSYDSVDDLISIGREKNTPPSAFDTTSYNVFPGTICRFTENGVDMLQGVLTGDAVQIDCGNPPPPPPPPPPITECEIDPNSVACACETTPHPACNVCP